VNAEDAFWSTIYSGAVCDVWIMGDSGTVHYCKVFMEVYASSWVWGVFSVVPLAETPKGCSERGGGGERAIKARARKS